MADIAGHVRAPEAPRREDTGPVLRPFLAFAVQYWRGRRRREAWLLLSGIVITLVATLGANFAYNYWNRAFFDRIGAKDLAGMWQALVWLPIILGCGTALAVATSWMKQTLQAKWRADLSSRLLSLWLGNQRYYRIAMDPAAIRNVEHRIVADVRQSTEMSIELSVGFFWATTNALMFLGILLAVGGSLAIGGIAVPGYMALVAIAYACIVTGSTAWVGRRLSGAAAERQEREAELQYDLTRVRENSESIAFMRGDAREFALGRRRLAGLVTAYSRLVRENCSVSWITNTNSFLAPVIPAVLAAPKFMSGELTLGGVMQVVAAFGAVLGALNWFGDNFVRLSELRAHTTRVAELLASLERVDQGSPDTSIGRSSADGEIELRDVTLRKNDGSVLIDRANVTVMPGERILIEGRSGTGKSTLLRMLAGLWPWAEGRVTFPSGSRISFVPQRPYIPIGRLADALTYPSDRTLARPEAAALLERVGLGHLADRVEEVGEWDARLSGGERQRLAFARVLLERPDVIVLDEATSALDDEGQATLFDTLVSELPDATILNVAHRQGLQKFHHRRIVIAGSGGGGRTIESRPTLAGLLGGIADGMRRKFSRRQRVQPNDGGDGT